MSEPGSVELVLRTIEDRYWRPIEQVTSLESLLEDDRFFADPGRHVALFSDHGVVHVRDVAARAAELAVRLGGGLIAARPPERSAFVAGAAALLAYLHDVGMTPLNEWGRPVHAQYAAQVPFTDAFGPLLDDVWACGAKGLRLRIESLAASGGAAVPPTLLLREVLAKDVAHSKSAVPTAVLDDRPRFREVLRRTVLTSLAEQAGVVGVGEGEPTDAALRYEQVGVDVEHAAFSWLIDQRSQVREFTDDVVDAIRVLRAADALRQRGTTLRTSSGFEICADRATGRGVFALRTVDRRILALFSDTNPFSGAEANVHEADLTESGSLRIEFHRESFGDPDAADRIAEETAALVVDIEADVLGSFDRSRVGAESGVVELIRRELDAPLVGEVAARLRRSPRFTDRVVVIDAPRRALAPDLRDWPTQGVEFEATPERIAHVVAELRLHGMNTDAIDLDRAFEGVREVRIRPGEQVFAPHTRASAVLIPMGDGLELVSTGGYGHRVVPAWIPAGVTGVVRDGERNALVQAVAEVDVLVVPDELFVAEWFRPYEGVGLREAARGWIR